MCGSSEQWDGARVGLDGACDTFGADDAYQLTEMGPQLGRILTGLKQVFVMSPDGGKYSPAFLEATKSFHEKFYAGNLFVEQLRLFKSENELDRMRYAADIGADGFIAMMQNTRPGITELALSAEFESTCKRNGAMWNSFPCVVGAGANAAVIHYLAKRSLLQSDELVLVDSGCEVAGGYVSDITRTWPVSAEATVAQRALYDFILDVQKQCLVHLNETLANKQSISLDQLHDYSVKLMIDGLQSMGILPKQSMSRAALSTFQKYNPTHIGHYLGMDVHDTPHVTRAMPLTPGMVITVEPGIYLPKNDQDIPAEFRGIGIRIEDDVIVCGPLRHVCGRSSLLMLFVCRSRKQASRSSPPRCPKSFERWRPCDAHEPFPRHHHFAALVDRSKLVFHIGHAGLFALPCRRNFSMLRCWCVVQLS